MLAGESTFSTSITTPESVCTKIPDEMTYAEAASMVLAYSTAIHSLMTLARVEKGMVS
jgi:NADPH:quinone reductase-like Zn-dependent oxidoreductase